MNHSFGLAWVLVSIGLLASCGPDSNSRYGDEYWDPQATWDNAQVISQPALEVTYRDTDPADNVEVWEAYVAIDFSDLLQRADGDGSNEGQLKYSVGTSLEMTVDDFLQNGKTWQESDFIYDATNAIDYRLRIQEPENYTFYLDLSVRQPNGTLRVYNFAWYDVIVPGDMTRDIYWANRMNGIMTANCTSCHNNDGSNAHAAFDLDTNNTTTTLSDFVDEVLVDITTGQEILTWPFNASHSGIGNANQLSSREKADFEEFVTAIIDYGASDDFTLTTIAEPAVMTLDPYAP